MQISMSLITGRNYISFPATSTDNFGTIFIVSGIKDNIILFQTYDTILGNFTLISDFEYIEPGRGYIIDVISPGTITYDGIEYTFSFDQFKSRLVEGWNLVGTPNPMYIPGWCKILDPITNFPVSKIEPKKSYWANYFNCLEPKTEPILLISAIGLGIALISLYISLKGAKV